MKALVFWPVLVIVVLADFITKSLAETLLAGVPREVIGDTVRLVLVYNPGAAFGFHLGAYSRWIFMALTFGAVFILWRMYRNTTSGDLRRTFAIASVTAGAIGNLIDRIRTDLGVVDFLDIGFGAHRWPTFNIADIAVSGGAILLAIVLWDEDKRAALAETNATASTSTSQQASPAGGEIRDHS
ncbi:MAG: signal peptidase II [Gemmatimonas sp.]